MSVWGGDSAARIREGLARKEAEERPAAEAAVPEECGAAPAAGGGGRQKKRRKSGKKRQSSTGLDSAPAAASPDTDAVSYEDNSSMGPSPGALPSAEPSPAVPPPAAAPAAQAPVSEDTAAAAVPMHNGDEMEEPLRSDQDISVVSPAAGGDDVVVAQEPDARESQDQPQSAPECAPAASKKKRKKQKKNAAKTPPAAPLEAPADEPEPAPVLEAEPEPGPKPEDTGVPVSDTADQGSNTAVEANCTPLGDLPDAVRTSQGSFAFVDPEAAPHNPDTPASLVAEPADGMSEAECVSTDGTVLAQHTPMPPLREASNIIDDSIRFHVTSARRVTERDRSGLSYWLYQIVLQTRLALYEGQPHFPGQRSDTYFKVGCTTEIQCEKRYSDFEWLRGVLKALQPSVPVPPIPAKHASGAVDKVLDYFRADEWLPSMAERNPLIVDRQHGLELFLNYLGGSPGWRGSDEVRQFLLRGADELAQYKSDMNEEIARTGDKVPSAGNMATLSGWIRGILGTGGVVAATASDRMPTLIQTRRRFIESLHTTLASLLKEWDAWSAQDTAHSSATASTLTSFPAAPPPPSAADTPSSLPIQIDQRVVDADGHRGTVRWAGTLEKAPLPDMTYVGVEWDETGHGNSDGTVFGERMFECAANQGSFVPPELLILEPSSDADPLLTALQQTCRQVEIALTNEDKDRAATIRMFRGVVRFWCSMAKEVKGSIDYIEGLHNTAIGFEAQGAANGRSPELAAVQAAIQKAEGDFYAEWDYFKLRWSEASAQIVHMYVKVMHRSPHPFFVSLSEWIAAIKAEPPEAVGTVDLAS